VKTADDPEFALEKLRNDHDLSLFDCENPTLTTWLKKFAWTNQQADSAKTYVASLANRVVGYYSLTTGAVHKYESPERIAKGLANHPIGVILLARLAVDTQYQKKGLGKALLFDALQRVEEAADIVGVRPVLVHAIDEQDSGSTSTSSSNGLLSTLFTCCCYSRTFVRRSDDSNSSVAFFHDTPLLAQNHCVECCADGTSSA
jgi:GNAT superfamily N-acetyltransferase